MKQSKIEPLHSTPTQAETFLLKLLSNKKKLLKQGLIGIFALFLAFAFMNYWSRKKTQEIAQGSRKENLSGSCNLKKLKKIAKRYPTLQTQLDSFLAQSFLNENQLSSAKALISRVEKRQAKGLSFIQDFNEMTFLIENHQYKKALSLGKTLLEELEANSECRDLYLLHLARLVELEKLAHHPKKNTQLQSKLREYLTDHQKECSENFQLGRLNLVSFILDYANYYAPQHDLK